MSLAADLSEGESCVVLSPHLDDAVFSAWHVVSSRAEVRVVTVFAAIPEAGLLTPLDRAGGAIESAEHVRERLEDDRDALALAGREPTHVPLPDVQYRAERNPALRASIERDPKQFISLVAAEPSVHVARTSSALRWPASSMATSSFTPLPASAGIRIIATSRTSDSSSPPRADASDSTGTRRTSCATAFRVG